jgi:hypothetical protein
LSLGTKLTVLVPVAVLAVGAAIVAGRRLAGRAALAFAVPAIVTGGFWYGRNLAYAGNPLPWFQLHLGPLHLPGPDMSYNRLFGFSVAHYATSGRFWRDTVLHGLFNSFGVLAFVVLVGAALAAGAALLSLRRRGAARRPELAVLGAAVAIAGVAYLFTPWSAGGPQGNPHLFGLDLRFLAPALALGAVAAARSRWAAVVVGIAGVVTIVNQYDGRGKWPGPPWVSIGALVLLVGVPLAVLALRREATARVARPAVATLGAVLLLVMAAGVWGWRLESEEMQKWYATNSGSRGDAYRLMRNVAHKRVAVGGFADDYPLYGVTLTNHVQYIGVDEPHGGFRPAVDCREWLTQLRDGAYDYVVLSKSPVAEDQSPPQETTWTALDPSARVVLHRGITTVFRLHGRANPQSCGPQPSGSPGPDTSAAAHPARPGAGSAVK